jgi:hypothetical protein
MSNAELKGNVALADLIRNLPAARAVRERQFAAIARVVRHREVNGPEKDMMEQIRRDEKLCKLLFDYEEKSEIIGVMEFVIDLKVKAARRKSRRTPS